MAASKSVPFTTDQILNYHKQWRDSRAAPAPKHNALVGLGQTYRSPTAVLGGDQAGLPSQIMTELAGYISRQGGGSGQAIMADLERGDIGKYQSWIPKYTSWRAADTDRRNAQGFQGFGKLISTVAPMAMGFVPGLAPMAGVAMGAAAGGQRSGISGALLGGLSSAVAPAIKLPGGVSAAIRAPVTAAKNVAMQIANPRAAAQLIASRGLGAAQPKRRV